MARSALPSWVARPLFGDYDNGPLNEACDCDDPEGCAAARAAAARVELRLLARRPVGWSAPPGRGRTPRQLAETR
jgi:hypothetical protein